MAEIAEQPRERKRSHAPVSYEGMDVPVGVRSEGEQGQGPWTRAENCCSEVHGTQGAGHSSARDKFAAMGVTFGNAATLSYHVACV